MARTPAYVETYLTIRLVCDLCGDVIHEGDLNEDVTFADMVDAHEEHADKVHGEGV